MNITKFETLKLDSPELKAPAYEAMDIAIRRRAEILSGAITVIARDGLTAAKLKEIARESGVSLGLIQHYFDTRENLLDSAFEVMMNAISRGINEGTGGDADPLEQIFRTLNLHVYGTVVLPQRWGFWSELWAASGRSAHIRNVTIKIYESWAEPTRTSVQKLADEGRLPEDANVEVITAGLLALMDGVAVRTLAAPETFTPEYILDILYDWVAKQLSVTEAEKKRMRELIASDLTQNKPKQLSPQLIAPLLTNNK